MISSSRRFRYFIIFFFKRFSFLNAICFLILPPFRVFLVLAYNVILQSTESLSYIFKHRANTSLSLSSEGFLCSFVLAALVCFHELEYHIKIF